MAKWDEGPTVHERHICRFQIQDREQRDIEYIEKSMRLDLPHSSGFPQFCDCFWKLLKS